MDNVIIHRTPDYLKHHGIIGQKWGVMHGPPYPLGANVSRRVSAKGQQSDSKYYDAEKPKMANRKESSSKKRTNNSVNKNQNEKQPIDKKKQIIRNIAIGTAATAAILGAGYALYKTGSLKKVNDNILIPAKESYNSIKNIVFYGRDGVITMSKANGQEKQMIRQMRKATAGGNLSYLFGEGRELGCGYAALADDAREAGFNRVSLPKIASGTTEFDRLISKIYENGSSATTHEFGCVFTRDKLREYTAEARKLGQKWDAVVSKKAEAYAWKNDVERTTEIVDSILAEPGGINSRGYLVTTLYSMTGKGNIVGVPHVLTYKVNNGGVYFKDPLHGSLFNKEQFAENYMPLVAGVKTIRTDNLKFNKNQLDMFSYERTLKNLITTEKTKSIKDILAMLEDAAL